MYKNFTKSAFNFYQELLVLYKTLYQYSVKCPTRVLD